MSIKSIKIKINEILGKKGINKIEELSPDERQEYDNWVSILEGGEMTVEKIKEFCENQIKIIEGNYASGEKTDKADTMMRASLHVYLNLLKLINSPEGERQNLEKYLNNLIK